MGCVQSVSQGAGAERCSLANRNVAPVTEQPNCAGCSMIYVAEKAAVTISARGREEELHVTGGATGQAPSRAGTGDNGDRCDDDDANDTAVADNGDTAAAPITDDGDTAATATTTTPPTDADDDDPAIQAIPVLNADPRSWEARNPRLHTRWIVLAARYVWGIYGWREYAGRCAGLLQGQPEWVLRRRVCGGWRRHMDAEAECIYGDPVARARPVPFRGDPHVDYALADGLMREQLTGWRRVGNNLGVTGQENKQCREHDGERGHDYDDSDDSDDSDDNCGGDDDSDDGSDGKSDLSCDDSDDDDDDDGSDEEDDSGDDMDSPASKRPAEKKEEQ